MKTSPSRLKKLSISAVLLGAGSLSMLSHADVTLQVDDHIKVTAINGQELTTSLFQQDTKSFTLQPGQHVITAKYDRLYDLGRDEHDYLRSSNVSVAAEMADNQTYRLTMPNQPEDYRAAKEYAKKPTLAVQKGNSIIASQQSVGNSGSSIFSGLGKALGGVFGGGGDAELQNQQAIAALGNGAAVSTTTATSIKPYSAPVAQSTSTLDNFMQLWLQATPAEREKMRQWIQQ